MAAALSFSDGEGFGITIGMTVQQLDNVHRAKPFRPFTIHMGDGRALLVPHPEYLSRSPSGRTVIVYGNEEDFSILDLLLVTELEIHPPNKSPGEAAVSGGDS